MTEYRMRYRLQALGRHRSAWAEWGFFFLAVIVAAALLAAFAMTSPILSGPAPLPDSDPKPQASASGGQGGGAALEPAPPDTPN
jgi:hypothetical protein